MPLKKILFEIQEMLTQGSCVHQSFPVRKSLQDLLLYYFISITIAISYIVLICFVFYINKWNFPENITNRHLEKNEVSNSILLVLIIGPVVEELGFRSWLRYSKINFSSAICFFSYLIVSHLTFSNLYSFNKFMLYKLSFSLLLGVVSYNYLNYTQKLDKNLIFFWNNYSIYIIYVSIFSFSLLHILNFQLNLTNLMLIFFITMPQAIYGIFFSYVRLKYGIFYSIILHSMINITSLIPTFLDYIK